MRILKRKDKPYNVPRLHFAKHINQYDLLGSHFKNINGVDGVRFALWAPNAREVRVVGDFNKWNGEGHVMKKNKALGIWCLFTPNLRELELYKYEILTVDNKIIHKSDPFAFSSEQRPNTASVITFLKDYPWKDSNWISHREEYPIYDKPLNIYEVHLSSWKRDNENNFLNYRVIAHKLLEYVLEMEYTHIEILPVTEHPLDASWGYQSTGYFSVTRRFGTPEDFMYFVDLFHQNNIGIILDWVPGHFCKDDHGLYRFDGTSLYEYEDPRKGENYDWGTANFDLSKPQVRWFLISNALFWFDKYHIDGLRVDAVANMLYLNYGKKENIHLRNIHGGNENLEAIDFIKVLNKLIFKYNKNALVIAEDSSTFQRVTSPTYIGGLGFNYKWNMGWMNDMLRYMEMDPIHRKWHHNLITFSLMYAFSENFILPLSHDEVVHGKRSLLSKMNGDYWQKFASLRMFFGYMFGHPGKKMLFMGGEFGQFVEWRFAYALDWNLLTYPMHDGLKSYVKALNHIYIKEPSLWEIDHSSEGFQWIDHQNYEQSIISFLRKGKNKNDFLIVLCNFTPMLYEHYKVGVPRFVDYKEILNSDDGCFGGSNQINKDVLPPMQEGWNGQPYHIEIKVPPLAAVFIKPDFNSLESSKTYCDPKTNYSTAENKKTL